MACKIQLNFQEFCNLGVKYNHNLKLHKLIFVILQIMDIYDQNSPLPKDSITFYYILEVGLSQWLNSKESTCNAGASGDAGSIPGLGRSPGEGIGYPLQYSCLENAMDRGAWWATVHGVSKSQTQPK